MKHHHLSNIVVLLVLLVAVGGLYFIYKGTGRAVQLSAPSVDTLGSCCCAEDNTPFVVPATKLVSELTDADCSALCSERSTPFHPVSTLGMC